MKSQDPRRATEIKKLLKAAGIDPRLIRSRLDNYSMGSSLNVKLLSLGIDIEAVQQILSQAFERVRKCEMTGETLSGGNAFVFVDYHEDALIPDALLQAARSIRFSFSGYTPDDVKASLGGRELAEKLGISGRVATAVMYRLLRTDAEVRKNFEVA